MMTLDEKFKALEADNAPGQEVRQDISDLNTIMRGGKFDGVPVDFSHGDVDAFPPTPGSSEAWKGGFERGGQQAYTEYRGAAHIREGLANCLGIFTGRSISADNEELSSRRCPPIKVSKSNIAENQIRLIRQDSSLSRLMTGWTFQGS